MKRFITLCVYKIFANFILIRVMSMGCNSVKKDINLCISCLKFKPP